MKLLIELDRIQGGYRARITQEPPEPFGPLPPMGIGDLMNELKDQPCTITPAGVTFHKAEPLEIYAEKPATFAERIKTAIRVEIDKLDG